MNNALVRWQTFCERRDAALARSVRTRSEVTVMVATKHHTPVELVAHLKQVPEFPHDFGENYFQELKQKVPAPDFVGLGVRWHFIGTLQSRKIAEVVKIASTIHSVARVKELEILAQLREQNGSIPNFYLQFNTSNEPSKNGFAVAEAQLARETVERLKLMDKFQGLMCSAAIVEEVGEAEVRKSFVRLRDTRDAHFAGSGLNMGMSLDFDMAIEEGATLIRVGTLLLGAR